MMNEKVPESQQIIIKAVSKEIRDRENRLINEILQQTTKKKQGHSNKT